MWECNNEQYNEQHNNKYNDKQLSLTRINVNSHTLRKLYASVVCRLKFDLTQRSLLKIWLIMKLLSWCSRVKCAIVWSQSLYITFEKSIWVWTISCQSLQTEASLIRLFQFIFRCLRTSVTVFCLHDVCSFHHSSNFSTVSLIHIT